MKVLINYLKDRKQRLVNEFISAGVPEGSFLGPILFLTYISDLHDGIKLFCNIFADDKYIFSKDKDKSCSAVDLSDDLKIISIENYTNKQVAGICF